MKKLFTAEELEELRRADEELDAEFRLTPEDLRFSRRMDQEAALEALGNKGRKIAAQRAAYYEANRDKWNAYHREYRRKKKAASRGANTESGMGM